MRDMHNLHALEQREKTKQFKAIIWVQCIISSDKL